ncbi:TRAP transporter small permease [Virgibacillus salinus]|uniref:TRAP transporter small permease n=1 Tax=Virgibacillus salinus TaxID=553311 RepID=UPI001113E554|nr:TRAP transporter small permease [Virgibacillus salinus]
MKKVINTYIKVENFMSSLLLMTVVLFVFIASIMRWAGSPIAWSVDIAQLLFVWAIFLGANRSLRENRHIGVDFFVKKLPKKAQVVLEIIMLVFIIGFLVFLCRYGFMLSFENDIRQINSLSISYSFITIAVPIGCLLMSFTALAKIYENIKAFKIIS